MILVGLALVAAAGAIAQSPTAELLDQATHAIEAARPDQARLMIGRAVEAGAPQPAVDRLLADLAFADGDFARAVPLYDAVLAAGPLDARVLERAALARLHIGDMDGAAILLDRATDNSALSWRSWNARGVIADYRHDWAGADLAYQRASALAPDRAEVVNNKGWSLLLRGRWSEAGQILERAVALDPQLARAARNLELALAAADDDLPQRIANEGDAEWAARLNDAGVIAEAQGNNRKAIAAFVRALEARSQWFARAANNLARAEQAR